MSMTRCAPTLRLAALAGVPLLLAPLALAVPASAVPGGASPVWINEIHYDNAGTDTGEAIEVAAPAGSDLSNWSLVLYNGNGGGTYGTTTSLPATVPDSGNGWGFVTVTYPSNGIQNGAPDGVALVRDGTVVQFLSYEGTMTATNGPASGQRSTDIGVAEAGTEPVGGSLQLTGGPGGSPSGFSWTASGDDSFGAANAGQSFTSAPGPVLPPPAPPCSGTASHTISQVQGTGAVSPLKDQQVTVQAVVSALTPGLSGFFLQEEPSDTDADPLSSEGVFVRAPAPSGTAVGDTVRVTGTVREFANSDRTSSNTQISSGVTSVRCGSGEVPPAAELRLPVSAVSDFERYEGMRVTMPQSLVISEYFNYDRFNEVVVGLPLEGESRFFAPTAVVEPGPAANARAAAYALRRITVDDGRSTSNPSPPIFPGTVNTEFTLDNRFRGGDTLTGVTGVIEHTFGIYRLHPTADAVYTQTNPRPATAPAVGGEITVASFNVLNYFLTLDQAPTRGTCGPSRTQDCRGADNADELSRQRAKLVAAIAGLDADVVGLMEMENTPGVEPAADLVAGLNDLLGAGTYSYIDTGVIGTDAIRLGFLYRPAAVRPVGDFAVLDSSADPRFIDDKNRPALAQTFDQVGSGDRFTVAVNHLKSKGSDCGDVVIDGVPDVDAGDGQGNCNRTRTAAAEALADWLAGDPTGSGDPDSLIIGDLNSYDHEDPIDALVAAGFTDLVKQFGGEYAYGYVFDGQAGYLDHGLADATMAAQVTGAAEWHVNADEPDILDYDTTFKGPDEDALYEPDAYRSSDHDAVLIGLDLAPATVEACYADRSQSVESFVQGRRLNGTAVPRSMSDPQNALGDSDPGDEPYWTTLGLDGELVVEFARPVQNNNLAAADLQVVDVTDGSKGRTDRADVLASFDGSTWNRAGTVSGTGLVDLGPLPSARFIKVVDTTPTKGLPSSADGYDLDAVEVLSGCAR